jgi:hypothetical protein
MVSMNNLLNLKKIKFKHTVCCLIIFISYRLLFEKQYFLLYSIINLQFFQHLISSKILHGKEGTGQLLSVFNFLKCQ